MWDYKGFRIAKTTLRKINSGKLTLHAFECYKPTIMKTEWYWHKDRDTAQNGGVELRNRPPHVCFANFQ